MDENNTIIIQNLFNKSSWFLPIIFEHSRVNFLLCSSILLVLALLSKGSQSVLYIFGSFFPKKRVKILILCSNLVSLGNFYVFFASSWRISRSHASIGIRAKVLTRFENSCSWIYSFLKFLQTKPQFLLLSLKPRYYSRYCSL